MRVTAIPVRSREFTNPRGAILVFTCPNGHADRYRVDLAEDDPWSKTSPQLVRRVRCTTCEATCGVQIHLPGEIP